MILISAWKNKLSGLGHYSRAIKYYNFLKLRKKKVNFIVFKNLIDLERKLKNSKAEIILIDTYIFSKKISEILRKKFKKIIIINDNQFRLHPSFYLLDTFKYPKKNNRIRKYLGTNYLPFNKKIINQNLNKKGSLLIILGSNNQSLFFKFFEHIEKKEKNKGNIIVLNVKSKKIFNFIENKNIENWTLKKFVSQDEIYNLAKKAIYIISPGGQTMMNLVEANFFINVYITSNNQSFYAKKLKEKKIINLMDLKKIQYKKNKFINYLTPNFLSKKLKQNKFMKMFN
jgi:spore coat polysaccharide biosynthesis predicted glycosyltransferase SpsG